MRFKQIVQIMRGILPFVLLLSMLSGCASVSTNALELIGQPAPEARLMMLEGGDIAIRAKDGRTKVLLFWATWCPYSRGAIEDFEELAREYANRRDLSFYAVSVDNNQDIAELLGRISEQDLRVVQHVFSGNDIQDEVFLSLRGKTIPYAAVIDKSGFVRFLDIGVSGLDDYLATLD